jgi:hypothetical protein
MTRADRIEVFVIGAVCAVTWFMPADVLSSLTLGEAVLYLSALLLAQGLVRDLAMLLRHRRAAQGGVFQESQCLCLESAVGVTGIVVGSALLGSWSATPVAIGNLELLLAVAVTLTVGFLIKELVITWNPLGIRRERNPLSVIVSSSRK